MGSIYTPYDYGEAIIVKGVPYIRIGTQAAASTYTLNSETDFQDIADNDPCGFGFNNNGITFNGDNTSPLSASWTLEQCSIACGVEAFTSADWSAGTKRVTMEEGSIHSFFIVPADGELRFFNLLNDNWALGINGVTIKKTFNDTSSLSDSRGLRVTTGQVLQCGDDDNGALVALAGAVEIAWAFLPDEY